MNIRLTAAPLTLALILLAAAPASATTFCVPSFHAACPNAGGNVAQADLETALQADGTDGVADKVMVAAGTYVDPDWLQTGGTDPLEIVGAGRDEGGTVLTTTSTANIFVVNLAFGSRSSTTMRNLRIVVPESLPDGLGAGLQAKDAIVENVAIEVRNPGSDAAPSLMGTTTVRDSRIYSTGDGVIQTGIKGYAGLGPGSLTIERTTITGARYAIWTPTAAVPVFVRRSTILDPVYAGVTVRDGGFVVVENTVVRTAGGIPLDVTSHDGSPPIATLRNSTLVRTGGDDFPAVRVSVINTPGNASTNVQVSSTIAHGFLTAYDRQAPVSGAVGDANLTISHSNIAATGMSSGDGAATLTSNIYADPLFVSGTDYRLRAGSPSIDSGNPSAIDPQIDFDGLSRPFDGDGDGVARRDQGAYEYRPSVPSDPVGGGGPSTPRTPTAKDSTPPRISKLRLLRQPSARRVGRLSLTLSERARVVVTLKRIRKGAKARGIRQAFKSAPAGERVLRLAKRNLRPGRYRLTVVAIDAAGQPSKAARVAFVKRR